MADIQIGETFTDTTPDNAVTAARLNNAVSGAAILPGFITGKSSATPVGGDSLAFYDLSATGLAKCTWLELFAALKDAAANLGSPRTLGTGALTAAAGNDTRFPATVTGVVKRAGAGSTDIAAVPSDYTAAPTVGTLSAGAVTLNCALNLRFTVAVTANANITLTNIPDGSTVEVRTTQSGGFTCVFTIASHTQKWVGGSVGVVSAGAAAIDLWRFRKYGTNGDIYMTIEKSWS